MEITEVVPTAAAAETVEEMIVTAIVIVGADVKEMIVAAAVTQTVDVEMTAQIIAAATADQNSVLNQGLSKGPLCSIKMQDVDVKNIRIIVVIVNTRKKYLKMCGNFSAHFFRVQ